MITPQCQHGVWEKHHQQPQQQMCSMQEQIRAKFHPDWWTFWKNVDRKHIFDVQ